MFLGWSSLRMTSSTVVFLEKKEKEGGGGGARGSEEEAAEAEEVVVAAAASSLLLFPLALANPLSTPAADSGVYPATRKWHSGVGTSPAISPTRTLFMYPGNRSVAEALAITAAASALALPRLPPLFPLEKEEELEGEGMLILAALSRAVLSRTTTAVGGEEVERERER